MTCRVAVLRELKLRPSTNSAQPSHLSAASGLVRIAQRLYVVADDENSLAVFDLGNDEPGRSIELFAGELPSSHDERKAAKPDLEALAQLPAFDRHPFGALLAVGSGSRRNRMQAALLRLDATGAVDAAVRRIDLTDLLMPLRQRFAELNIEGAFVTGGELCLLQRGNTRSPANACIRFGLVPFLRWIAGPGGVAFPAPEAVSVTQIDLGAIDGVPLCFTDGVALPDGRWLFCAAAEDTADSYADGRCLGSAVGVVDANGTVQRVERLDVVCKVEGIALAEGASESHLPILLVSDADDRRIAAQLLSGTLAL